MFKLMKHQLWAVEFWFEVLPGVLEATAHCCKKTAGQGLKIAKNGIYVTNFPQFFGDEWASRSGS
jgi:hypothetical protein